MTINPRTPAIFLDMDETILHYTPRWKVGAIEVPFGYIVVRPHAVSCLQKLATWADVYVFSAGGPQYVRAALQASRLHYLIDGFFSSHLDNFLPSKGREWVLVDNLPAEHENTQEKLRQLSRFDSRVGPMRLHVVSDFRGDMRDDELRHLPEHLAVEHFGHEKTRRV